MKNEKAVRSWAMFGYFNSHCEGTAVTQPFPFQLMDNNSPPESSRVYLQSENEAGGTVNNKTPSLCIHPVLTALIQYTMTELPDGFIFPLLSVLKMKSVSGGDGASPRTCCIFLFVQSENWRRTDGWQIGMNVLRSSECRCFHTEHECGRMKMMRVVCCGLHRYEHQWEIFFFRHWIRNVAVFITTRSSPPPSLRV